MNDSIKFPIYRKSSTGSSFYRIKSAKELEECQLIGNRVFYYQLVAEQYPETLRIREMISLSDGVTVEATAEEFELYFEKLERK
jgi:hypothetical protein